jgi:NTP pyrophosphatase (non-canonical NTP hydrolase)
MNWQEQAAEFAEKQNLTHPPGVYALDLMSEVGEVAKEILRATGYGERPFTPPPSPNLALELGDTLYSLCQLASSAGIDLDTAFALTLEKYRQRLRDSGHISSETGD